MVMLGASQQAFQVMSPEQARGVVRDSSQRFCFQVPPNWWSSISQNPSAVQAGQRVIEWFESLGCSPVELARARKFDVAGYVGMPFPMTASDKTELIARYLSLWLLWDDVDVETLKQPWRIKAEDVLIRRSSPDFTRFDRGWWQLMCSFAERRSPDWIRNLCQAMETWYQAAVREAHVKRAFEQRGTSLDYVEHLELRVATIGMYATVYMLEDAYDFELPREFHGSELVLRLKWLANLIVGLGNDIFSFAKDHVEQQINLVTTLMQERDLLVDQALETLVRTHDEALREYDRLAASVPSYGAEVDAIIERWLQDVRYASLGFSLWEAQAPRYTAHQVVIEDRVIQPRFIRPQNISTQFTEVP